jgi:hypothetical protein
LTHVDEVDLPVVNAVYTVNDYDAEQLASNLERAQETKLTEIRAECNELIYAEYPVWYQANCDGGRYGSDVCDPMNTRIEAYLLASNTAETAVDEATTPSAVEAIAPSWPEAA